MHAPKTLSWRVQQPCTECPPPSSPTCPDPALATLLGESANATEQLQFMSNTESPSVNYIRSLTQIMSVRAHHSLAAVSHRHTVRCLYS
eukprot:572214-Pleurochrysis_carterae.AAC.4